MLAIVLLAAAFSTAAAPPTGAAAQFGSIHDDFVHGNLDVAFARAEAARLAILRASDTESLGWAQRFLLLEAEVLISQGKRTQAIDLLECPRTASFAAAADLAIRRKLLCGLAHLRLNRLSESVAELREARRLTMSSDRRLMGEVLAAEAQEDLQTGKLDAAIDGFRASLAVARAQGDAGLEASDLVNIGYLMQGLGRFSEAIDRLRDAERYARLIQAPKNVEAALGNIGMAYDKLGDFENALYYFQQAESEARQIGKPSAQADWLDDAGMEYYSMGNLEAALDYETRALALARSVEADEDIVDIETNLAFLLYQSGQFDAAGEHSRAAFRSFTGTPDSSAATWARFVAALLAARTEADDEAERSLTAVLRRANDSTLRADIENALANQSAERHHEIRADEWYRRAIKTFEGRRAAVANEELRLAAFGNGEGLYKDYADFLVATGHPDDALRLLDRSRARTLDEGLGARRGGRDAIHGGERGKPLSDGTALTAGPALARSLDATLLFYALGKKKSYLWVLTPLRTRLFVLPKESEIRDLVQSYQKTIQAKLRSSDPLREADPDALALYRMLVEPAASLIPRDATVYVIPDGSLNGLNFETLLVPDARGVHYWIEDVTLVTASSLRVRSPATGSPAPASAPSSLLLIGNPTSPRTEFPALPNAGAEIERIVAHFPATKRTVLTQAAAVPAGYAASGPGRFEYIHFVAHGTASRLNPLDSAVILSPPSDDTERFRLSARDIVQYPLHAKLVTISTCFGSGSRNYAGEGLVGLAWAFLRAGSPHVISALWEADDESTPQLMDAMYRELELGRTPARALRSAKLALVHSSGKNRKPLYWAPFQLYAGS